MVKVEDSRVIKKALVARVERTITAELAGIKSDHQIKAFVR